MNWKLCVVLCLACVTSLPAEGPRGTAPRETASGYSAHAEVDGVSVGAALLGAKQVRRIFVSDVNRCCLVVEVALYPQSNKPLSVSLDDFVLRMKDSDVAAKPTTAAVVAASLQKQARSDRDITVSPVYGVGYESGRGYDPVTGTRDQHGWGQTAGVGVGVGSSGSNPASTDKDRLAMQTELVEKGLPEGSTAKPVAGYIYFAVAPKKGVPQRLEYSLGENKVVLQLP